jgi:hypothetical protein
VQIKINICFKNFSFPNSGKRTGVLSKLDGLEPFQGAFEWCPSFQPKHWKTNTATGCQVSVNWTVWSHFKADFNAVHLG